MKRTLIALSSFLVLSVAGAWSGEAQAKADKSSCRRVAKSAGLMSAVIENACSGYKEYQTKCLTHVGREGLPDLVRADNYMQCLCDQAKQGLSSEAGGLCHASSSIHGLLDSYMRVVQTAAQDTDRKKQALSKREKSLDRLEQREEDAKKSSEKAHSQYQSVKSRTDQALAKNQKTQDQAQKLYEQTIAKLRAAQKAAEQKLASIKSKLNQENQALHAELSEAERKARGERDRYSEVNQAVSMRQREVGLAKNVLATAQVREKKAVDDHRRSIGSSNTSTPTVK